MARVRPKTAWQGRASGRQESQDWIGGGARLGMTGCDRQSETRKRTGNANAGDAAEEKGTPGERPRDGNIGRL